MTKRTLKVLKSAIVKWERILSGKGADKGFANCALCRLFITHKCRYCPVQLATGKRNCEGAPYERWVKHQRRVHEGEANLVPIRLTGCKTCRRLAEEELAFLKSLLPKGAAKI